MNIINKFKFNYSIKLLEDFVLNNNKSDALSLLIETKKKNKEVFYQLMTHFLLKYKNHPIRDNFFNNRIFLVNSFEIDDCNYLGNFFSFYFDNIKLIYGYDSLSNAIIKDIEYLQLSTIPQKINFQYFIEFSEFLFNSLLINEGEKNLFLKSNSAFFEANGNKFFIYPNSTAAYFLIHQNPLNTYNSLKTIYQSSQEALNVMFNFQDKNVSNQDLDSKYHVEENRQSWNTFLSSWKDPNVISTYRGLLIPKKDFIQSPNETLTKALFHLIQAGLKIEVDYNLIDQFVQKNPLEETTDEELSNKEKKLLLNNLDQKLLEFFNYKI